MTDHPIVLGIIPARGGSKSIPQKNIKTFLGKPLIAWKIETAKKSGILDRLIVSTDSPEIREVAKQYGAEVPFMRPAELAEDTTPTLPVLQHAVRYLEEQEGYRPDVVVLLEPTTPGVRSRHLREAKALFSKTKADSVISVVEVPSAYNPHWQFNMDEDGRLTLFTGVPVRQVIRRRQDLPKTYHRNSAIYMFRPELLFQPEPSLYGGNVVGYLMEKKFSMDLDQPEDWESAEVAMQKILEERS